MPLLRTLSNGNQICRCDQLGGSPGLLVSGPRGAYSREVAAGRSAAAVLLWGGDTSTCSAKVGLAVKLRWVRVQYRASAQGVAGTSARFSRPPEDACGDSRYKAWLLCCMRKKAVWFPSICLYSCLCFSGILLPV